MSGFSYSPVVVGAVGKWESRGVCGFSTARRAVVFCAAGHHAIFLHRPPSGHFRCDVNPTFHGSTTGAVFRACSRRASCDSPAARGDPLWAWAALLSWPWPLRVLPPELELGLKSPPNSPPDRDSESASARLPIRTP